MQKKFLSMITAIVMLLSLLPQGIITVSAAMSGSGTATDPYIITTAAELSTIGGSENKNKYFRLGNDITVDSSFSTIDTFYGVLNGNGKTITGVDITEKINSNRSVTSTGRLFNTIEANAIVYNLTLSAPKLKVDYTNVASGSGSYPLNRGLFVNINKGTLNNISLENVNLDADVEGYIEVTQDLVLTVRELGVMVYRNYGEILNSNMSGTVTAQSIALFGSVTCENLPTGTVANVVSDVELKIVPINDNDMGYFHANSLGIAKNQGYVYNLWALGTISGGNNKSYVTKSNRYLCAYNSGTIEHGYYKTSTGKFELSGAVNDSPPDSSTGTSSGLVEKTALDNSLYSSNQSAKAGEIQGTGSGALYTVEWKRENGTIANIELYNAGSITIPYTVDKDYYCETWKDLINTVCPSGSSYTLSGNAVFTAQNVQGKYYPDFNGEQYILPSVSALPTDYPHVWKKIGAGLVPDIPSDVVLTTEIAKVGSDGKATDFSSSYTGTISVGDKFCYRYTIVSTTNDRVKLGTYNMYTENSSGVVTAPSYKVEKITLTADNYESYIDLTVPTGEVYLAEGGYHYPTATGKSGAAAVPTGNITLSYKDDGGNDVTGEPTAVGTYSIFLSVAADENFNEASGIDTGLIYKIDKAMPSMDIYYDKAKYGSDTVITVNLRAKLKGDGTDGIISGGTVTLTFEENGVIDNSKTQTKDVNGASLKFTVTNLPNAGTPCDCTLTYSGNDNYQAKVAKGSFVVGQAPSTTAVTLDKTSYTYGEDMLIMVDAPQAADQTEISVIDKYDTSADISFVEKNSDGKYVYKYTMPKGGDRTVKAEYIGSTNYSSSSDTKTVTVEKLQLTVTATPAESGYEYQDEVKIKLSVTGVPTGGSTSIYDLSMAVKKGENILSSMTVSNVVPFTDKEISLGTALEAGTYDIYVASDDDNYTVPMGVIVGSVTVARRAPVLSDFSWWWNSSDLTYDKTEKTVNVTSKTAVASDMGAITVEYRRGGEIVTAPVDAGFYYAYACVDDSGPNIKAGTVEIVGYGIIEKTPDASDMTVKINGEAPLSEYPYTGKTVTATVTSADEGAFNVTAVSYYKKDSEGNYVLINEEPANAGSYKVKVNTAEGTNYFAATDVEVATFEIKKADPKIKFTNGGAVYYYDSAISVGGSIQPDDSIYGNAKKPTGTITVVLNDNLTHNAKVLPPENVTFQEEYGTFNITILPKTDFVAGHNYMLELTYSGDENYNTATLTSGNYQIEKSNVIFSVSETEHQYSPGEEKGIKVQPKIGGMSEVTDVQNMPEGGIVVKYYAVDENEGKLASTTPVQKAIAPGRYLYVISLSPEASANYQCYKSEYTVSDTAIPDFSAYGNVGYMDIKSGNEAAQKPIYFDNAVVNAHMTDTVTNPLNNPNASTVTYESKNTSVAKVNSATGEVTIMGAGSAVIVATSTKTNTSDVYASYTLNVTKEVVTVTATSPTVEYGTEADDIPHTYSVSKAGITLGGTAVYTTAYTNGSGCGQYSVEISGLASDVYDITFVPGTLTVTPKTLTLADLDITAKDKAYDGSDKAEITASVKDTALVSGDIVSVLAQGTFDNANASDSDKNVSYTVTGLSGTHSGNYTLTGTLTGTAAAKITKAPVTVSVPATTTYVYDGENKSVNAVAYANGIYFDKFNVTYNGSTDKPKNVGTYTVGVEITDSNYVLSGDISAQLIIREAQQDFFSIEGVADTVTYGDANFDLQADGVDAGATVTYAVTSGTAAEVTADGNVTVKGVGSVTVEATSTLANHTVKAATRTFTVKPKTLYVTAAPTSTDKVYDGTKTVDVTLTLDGVVSGDDVTASHTSAVMASADVENNKTVFVNGITLSGADTGKYQLASPSVQTSVNVTKRPITAIAFTAKDKVYDENAKADYTITNLDGVLDDDKAFVTVIGSAEFTDANAGENKTVTLSGLTLSGTKSGNYELNVTGDVTAQASISKAKVEFTLGTLEYTYDGTEKTVPVTAAVDGEAYTNYTVAYQKDGSVAETVNAGEYDVVITLGDTTNYETDYTPKTLKIVKASQSAITITGLIGTIDYGAVFALSAAGGNGDGAVTWASSNPGIAEIDVSTGVVTIKGTGEAVTITATKAESENFGGEQTATVTFTPIKKSVGFKVTNLNQIYDGSAKSVTVAPSVGSENFTITYTDEKGDTVDAPTNAGIYYADVHATGHYDGYTTAVLTIKNAAVNTSGYTFNVADAVYGSTPVVTQPESTEYPSGAEAKVTYTGSGIYSETTEQPKNAGSYTAILTISGDNYETVRLTDSFVITKAVLTAKPDNASRSYGEQNPVFTVSYSGFVNGDNESAVMIAPSMTTNATVSSGTGTYAIRASGGYAENYTFSYEDGTLTVGTASGGNFYIHGGQSNPYVGNKFTLTAYYNNEKPTVEWSSGNTAVATVNSATGEVEIVGSGTATITAKMNDSRFDNTLTAEFTLTAVYLPETQSPIYFDSLLVEKYVTDGAFTNPAKGMSDGAAVKYTSSNPEVAAVDETSGEVTILKAGTTVIKATSTKFNCADVYASYTLTVKKAPITVSADDIALTYGDSFTATDITISGGVTAEELSGTLAFTTKYAVGKGVGEYEVTPNGLTSDTYDITFESGTITVTEKVLNKNDFTIIAENKTYDQTNSANISAAVKADALVGADNLRAEISGHFADENAGEDKAISYEITSLSGKGFENYVLGNDVNTAIVTADITPAKVTFFVSEETTRIYDSTAQKVDISAMALGNVFGESNYTVYYQAAGEEKTTEPKNAGEYTVTVELTDGSRNYEAIQPTAKLVIEVDAAANLYISGSNKNVAVDDVFKLYAYYGNQTPEVEWTSSDETVAEVNSTTGEVTILKAGTATITATAKDANYGSAEFELEASKKRINIKAPAGELVKTYNGERQDINFTSSDIDLKEKGIAVNASYVLLTDSSVTEPNRVGTYTVSYEIDDERYTADGNVMLTINKANVVVKAKNISKEYGEEPQYEIEILSGGNVTDVAEMTTLAEFASDGAEKTANVGTYDITVTLTSNGDENRNFIVSDEKGTLAVTKAPLTVTVKDVTREYGAENPALEAEYEGFKNEETADVLTGELVLIYDESINAETAVGSYIGKTTASGLSSDNYDITFVPGNVTVTKIGVKASAGTSRSSYLTVKLDKAVPGLTANNFVVKNGDENITLTEVTASSDNKTYTLKGSFSTSVTYTVAINLAGTESDATHEIISEALPIKPSSGSTGGGGGGGGGSVATTYTVTFETNGGNKIDSVKVSKNGILSKPTEPTKEGFDFDGWYTDKALKTAYDFDTKVTKSFTLYAKWTEKATEPVEPTEPIGSTAPEWKNPFTDVKKSDWFYTNVEYAVNNKLMNGTTATTFAPNEPLTRGMLVAILYRAEGEPAVNKSIPFSDVDADAYYANATIWAQQNGIVNGVTENAFAPDDNITREQIAAIMFRYAKYKGYDVSVGESTNILSYTDAESISEYAITAMQYAVGSGLMKGKTESTINPKDVATRAEIAAILQRFLEANK